MRTCQNYRRHQHTYFTYLLCTPSIDESDLKALWRLLVVSAVSITKL